MTDRTTPPVDTLVWDMGGIFRIFFTEVMVRHGRERGWPLDELPLGPTGPAHDEAYAAMDRGELTEPAYLARVMAALAEHDLDYDPRAVSRDAFTPREPVWALIHELAARDDRRQAVLTNDATAWLGASWWETWPQRDLFDAIVDAGHLGTRKPAPEPYLAVLAALDADPARCVFVDDMHTNVAGARAVGMHGVWFDIADPDGSVARLRRTILP